jgi:hypothetical protein
VSDNDFPLTLAETLYRELGHADLMTAKDEGNLIFAEVGSQVAGIESLSATSTDEQITRFLNDNKIAEQEICQCRAECSRTELIWSCKQALSRKAVSGIYAGIHKLQSERRQTRTALCLSGGGVRSATFNLGVLQGLARCRLLEKFDYLSTVSGGGFIGSWLTAWIHRQSLDCVMERLREPIKPPINCPASKEVKPGPLKPEPDPVYNLRVYANYLTPRKGLFSPDTWTLIAVYLRNLFLNWLVFVPAILTFLMVPRLWANVVNVTIRYAPNHGPFWPLMLGLVGLGCGLLSLICITLNLPSICDKNWRTRVILFSCVLPLVLMAVCLSLYWVMVRNHIASPGVNGWISSVVAVIHGNRPSWHVFVIAGAIVPALPQLAVTFKARTPTVQKIRLVLLVAAGGAVTGALTYALLNLSPGLLIRLSNVVQFGTVVLNSDLLYVSLSVPFLLCIFMIGGTFVAGFSSRFSGSEDQEWWARCGAWMLMMVLGWGLFNLVVMFGPALFIEPLAQLIRGSSPAPTQDPHTFADCCALLLPQKPSSWSTLKTIVTTLIGIISGAISLFGGFSSKTKGNGKEEDSDPKSRIFSMVTSIAAAIFALYIAIVLVWATDWVLLGLAKPLSSVRQFIGWFVSAQSLQAGGRVMHVHASSLPSARIDHQNLVTQSPWWFEFFATGLFALATLALGWCINTNRFSLHYYWRNRMMRSYLGSTRDANDRNVTKSQFTDFDTNDNIQMHELTQKRPFHVVNVTLNLVGGDKLEWQDRRAESFTMSPLHCGSYWLGYRKSEEYGGDRGMSLATAVAISGAAASPNMGYMMTSPIVRIIMTLFNIRLGFWLGNPGPYSGEAYKLDSPVESVRPIVEEALGMTNDRNPYVYLSDGGHFENLGLYEMILRRCRFIVVSDASTDTKYAYESLAMAIRQIRVDFGVPIDMGEMKFDKVPDTKNNYCALGLIRYSRVDKNDPAKPDSDYDGVLVYVKPSLIGEEPRDVLNYQATSPTFPEETIADQWFSESQFESYRALGSHMIETICEAEAPAGNGGADQVMIGTAKISPRPADSNEEIKIEGRIEKVRPSSPETGENDLEKHLSAAINSLTGSKSEQLPLKSPDCADFGAFANKARWHITRARKLTSKDS